METTKDIINSDALFEAIETGYKLTLGAQRPKVYFLNKKEFALLKEAEKNNDYTAIMRLLINK